MQPKAIVFDLDGTLLTSEKTVTERTKQALEKMKASGIPLLFATARPPRFTRFNIDFASLGSLIFYNGALFHCPYTKKTKHVSIANPLAKAIIQYILSIDEQANVSIEVQDKWFSPKPLDYRTLMKVEQNPTVIDYSTFTSFDCTKILVTDFQYPNKLHEKYRDLVTIHVTDSGQLVQIMARQCSKETAVEYLLTKQKISLEDTLCFGDDYNDVGLFQSCGYSVAMGNAMMEVKEIATEVTDTNDHDGVAKILERFF
ncbi:Cof-type HAD-IIB family hydrolase [Alkalihalobacterium bogoriense]|uniref:Cof-type HAD-IIB family hydrolase n=1 Tax=Alkalihalobacterium bogoriense TaxID=246272 RepID=UPI000553A11A|nr:Cof-type HAD-IIB family hydrolase [Alkalihalobacterium bogoriense]